MTSGACLSHILMNPLDGAHSLDAPFWQAAAQSRLVVQRCLSCLTWRWSPEWICHACHSPDFSYEEVEARGVLESWSRVWYPVSPLLKDDVPYTVVLVRLPQAGNVRMVGNYAGKVEDNLINGSSMRVAFEQHQLADASDFALVQWQLAVD